MKYRIELLETATGYRFNFISGNHEKIITWAGSEAAMNIPEKGWALRVKESLEKYPVFFDENDNMIIPSPLYFLLSVEKSGVDSMIAQIENWPVFWSQDAFFHRSDEERIAAAQEGVSGPVKTFLREKGFRYRILPNADYNFWDDLEDRDFLNEEELSALHKLFNSLSDKEKTAVLYLAFNSPHFVSAIAWVQHAFRNEEDFAHYSLVMEGLVCPVNIDSADFERELRLREEMFAEVRLFLS